MSNPFDDESRTFMVLTNHEDEHSLWPATVPVPDGWTVAHPADSREACLAYTERHWSDLRPRSLR